MKAINEMRLQMESRSCNEAFARTAVAGFLAALDPTVEEISDVKTAVSEAVTNCIVHAYPEEIGTIYIHVKIFENGRVAIAIRDRGRGIENIPQAMEPLFTTRPGEERAGLGFSIMGSFMDKLRVRSQPGRGCTVHLEKTIVSKGKQDGAGSGSI